MSLTDELDRTMASGVDLRAMLDPAASGEVRRIMQICNACRYCEGFCAVFPAMERRRLFTDGDVSYLANLCHNCGDPIDPADNTTSRRAETSTDFPFIVHRTPVTRLPSINTFSLCALVKI